MDPAFLDRLALSYGYALYRLSREKETLPYFHRVLNLISDGAQTKKFFAGLHAQHCCAVEGKCGEADRKTWYCWPISGIITTGSKARKEPEGTGRRFGA